MSKPQLRSKACRTPILVVALLVASSAPALAGRPSRCDGDPFSFSDVQTTEFVARRHRARVGFEASGSTQLACPGGVQTIDVWEHAVVRVEGRAGSVHVVGDVTLRVAVPDGGTVVLGGVMIGGGACGGGLCSVRGEVRARGPRGEALRLEQVMTIDSAAGEVTSVDVRSLVIRAGTPG